MAKRRKKNSKKKHSKVKKGVGVLELKPADVLDGMKNFSFIGEGKSKFTSIYSATNKSHAKVALKLFVLRAPDKFQQNLRHEKFKQEVKTLKLLEPHSHIVRCIESEAKEEGELNGKKTQVHYYTMELLNGSLTDHMEDLQTAQIPWLLESKISVLIQICKAIKHAHSKGIYHRDIYAENILLINNKEPLHTKLSDFGAAHNSAIPSTLQYYQPLGALTITSPEMHVGLANTEEKLIKSDIFSTGLLIYNLIMEQPHGLQTSLAFNVNPSNNSGNQQQREDILRLTVIPHLQRFTTTSIIVVGKGVNNGSKIEVILNDLIEKMTAYDYRDREDSLDHVITELSKCRDLINA